MSPLHAATITARGTLFALASLLAACTSTTVAVVETTVTDDGVDYAVTGSAVQWTDVPPARRLVVRCYCPVRTTVIGTDPNRIELRFDGRKDSVGYHGDQTAPTVIPESLMRFIARPHAAGLLVESREYTYIHHAFLLAHRGRRTRGRRRHVRANRTRGARRARSAMRRHP